MNINKIITIASVLELFSINAFAQLQVDSLGHVGIGMYNNENLSLLSIGQGFSGYTVSVQPTSGIGGIYLKTNRQTGIQIENIHTNLNIPGIEILPGGVFNQAHSTALRVYSGVSSTQAIGVCGAIPPIPCGAKKKAAIYGSISSGENFAYNGTYAGYFYGNTRVTDTLFSNVIITPSVSLSNLHVPDYIYVSKFEDHEKISEKLSDISLVEIYEDKRHSLQNRYEDIVDSSLIRIIAENPEYDVNKYLESTGKQNPSMRYGLAADQLREIYPELVSEDDEGNISINYVEMVPLLVQSIKELKAEIEELKGATPRKQVAPRKNGNTTSMADSVSDLISLSQNDPNPFTTETTIAVTLPETVKTAAIVIYDMSGKKVKQIDVTGRGETTIDVTSEGLTQGMYLYSLIADGKVMSTKRMILN